MSLSLSQDYIATMNAMVTNERLIMQEHFKFILSQFELKIVSVRYEPVTLAMIYPPAPPPPPAPPAPPPPPPRVSGPQPMDISQRLPVVPPSGHIPTVETGAMEAPLPPSQGDLEDFDEEEIAHH